MARRQTFIKIICESEEIEEDIYKQLEAFLISLDQNWDVDMHYTEDRLGRKAIKVTNTKKNEE